MEGKIKKMAGESFRAIELNRARFPVGRFQIQKA